MQTKQKQRKGQEGVWFGHLGFCYVVCSVGWNLSNAGPHTLVPLLHVNVHGEECLSRKLPKVASQTPEVPGTQLGPRPQVSLARPWTRRESRRNEEVSNLKDTKKNTPGWSHTCRLLLCGLPALEMERASSCSLGFIPVSTSQVSWTRTLLF